MKLIILLSSLLFITCNIKCESEAELLRKVFTCLEVGDYVYMHKLFKENPNLIIKNKDSIKLEAEKYISGLNNINNLPLKYKVAENYSQKLQEASNYDDMVKMTGTFVFFAYLYMLALIPPTVDLISQRQFNQELLACLLGTSVCLNVIALSLISINNGLYNRSRILIDANIKLDRAELTSNIKFVHRNKSNILALIKFLNLIPYKDALEINTLGAQ